MLNVATIRDLSWEGRVLKINKIVALSVIAHEHI